jgi:hypothetical protein
LVLVLRLLDWALLLLVRLLGLVMQLPVVQVVLVVLLHLLSI